MTSAKAKSSQTADVPAGDDLGIALSVIEVLAGIASVAVAITVYKLMARKRECDADVNPDVEMNSLSSASTARTNNLASANDARPGPVAY